MCPTLCCKTKSLQNAAQRHRFMWQFCVNTKMRTEIRVKALDEANGILVCSCQRERAP